MSKIDSMIARLFPDGVEYKPLSELGEFFSGLQGKSGSDFAPSGNARFIPYKNIFDNREIDFSNLSPVQVGEGEKQNRVHLGDVLFTGSSETPDECGMSSAVTVEPDEPVYLNSFCFGLRPFDTNVLSPEFSKHIFRSSTFRAQAYTAANGVTRYNVSKKAFAKLVIPVPPMEIQQEIVCVLDSFAELEAELEARRAQYAYYRDKLLDFAEREHVQWLKLGDVCKSVCSGGTPSRKRQDYYKGNIPWLRTQEVNFCDVYETEMHISDEALENSSAKWIPENCVIVAMYGATAGKAAINKIPLTTNQACCNLEIDEHIASYRYVYHWVCNEYLRIKGLGQGSQNNISGATVKAYPIPVPPLEEQERIVGILDKFDALVNDISQGIPAEIEARRTQYAYYRDKLLDFSELVL